MPRLFLLLFVTALPFSSDGNTLQQLETELKQQKYSHATSTGQALLSQQPENARIQFLTALAFQYNNQPKRAQHYYQKIIRSHPELPEPRNNLAMIYLQQGKHDQAVDLLITSLETHPAYATAWQNLSNLYQGLASEAYRKALSEENNASSVLHNIKLTALTSLHLIPVQSKTPGVKTMPQIQLAKAPATPEQENSSKNTNPQTDTAKQLDQILTHIIQNWAAAWGNKQFGTYINAYTANYKGNNSSHNAWVDYRRSRIKRPGKISVKISNIHIKSRNATRAIIDFHQTYKSATYQDKIAKRIYLTKINNNWKISREKILAIL